MKKTLVKRWNTVQTPLGSIGEAPEWCDAETNDVLLRGSIPNHRGDMVINGVRVSVFEADRFAADMLVDEGYAAA